MLFLAPQSNTSPALSPLSMGGAGERASSCYGGALQAARLRLLKNRNPALQSRPSPAASPTPHRAASADSRSCPRSSDRRRTEQGTPRRSSCSVRCGRSNTRRLIHQARCCLATMIRSTFPSRPWPLCRSAHHDILFGVQEDLRQVLAHERRITGCEVGIRQLLAVLFDADHYGVGVTFSSNPERGRRIDIADGSCDRSGWHKPSPKRAGGQGGSFSWETSRAERVRVSAKSLCRRCRKSKATGRAAV